MTRADDLRLTQHVHRAARDLGMWVHPKLHGSRFDVTIETGDGVFLAEIPHATRSELAIVGVVLAAVGRAQRLEVSDASQEAVR